MLPAGVRVPHDHHVVTIAYKNFLIVMTECNREYVPALERAKLLARYSIPQDGLFVRAGEYFLAIVTEGYRIYFKTTIPEGPNLISGQCVPEDRRSIGGTGKHVPAIRAKYRGIHPQCVASL